MKFNGAAQLSILVLLPAWCHCQGQQPRSGDNIVTSWVVGRPVKTTSGTIIGHAASKRRNVSEYLGIPYAEAPIGNLRFAAPQAYYGKKNITALKFSPDCPTNVVAPEKISPIIPLLALPQALQILSNLGQIGNNQSEDCLTLNIWTKPQTGSAKKAVMVWIYGGGFTMGTTNNPTYNGQYFADTEDVVLVTLNYRVNIFGFPGLKGAGVSQNPGLLDQRLAIEWVERNIASFGGDPRRITIFGESAGSASVDYYQYAYQNRPIVQAFIQQSATAQAFNDPAPADNVAVWYNASKTLGCGGPETNIGETVECVRKKPFQEVLAAIKNPDPLRAVMGSFGPTVDNRVVFSDYAARAKAGKFIKKPLLIGSNFNEAGLFKVLALAGRHNVSEQQWALFNQGLFQCPTAVAAKYRADAGVDVYRYLYLFDFPNLRLTENPPSKAYHSAEVPVVFETAEETGGLPNNPSEKSVSRYMNAAWAAFARDPQRGLQNQPFQLPKYSPGSSSLILFAENNSSKPSITSASSFDALCASLDSIGSRTAGGLPGLLIGSFLNGSSASESGALAAQVIGSLFSDQDREKLKEYVSMLRGDLDPITGKALPPRKPPQPGSNNAPLPLQAKDGKPPQPNSVGAQSTTNRNPRPSSTTSSSQQLSTASQAQQSTTTSQAQQSTTTSQAQQPTNTTPPQQPTNTTPPQQPKADSPPKQPKADPPPSNAPPPQQPKADPPPKQPSNAPPLQQPKADPPPQQPSNAPPPQQPNTASPPQQPNTAPPPQQQNDGESQPTIVWELPPADNLNSQAPPNTDYPPQNPNIVDPLQPTFGNQQQPGVANPQQPKFGNQPQPGFGNQQQPGFGNQQQPSYGDRQQPGFGVQQQPGFENAQQPSFGEPRQPKFGNPQQPSFENSQQPSSGAPQQPNLGNSQQPSFGVPQQPNPADPRQPSVANPQQPSFGSAPQPSDGYAQQPNSYPSQEPSFPISDFSAPKAPRNQPAPKAPLQPPSSAQSATPWGAFSPPSTQGGFGNLGNPQPAPNAQGRDPLTPLTPPSSPQQGSGLSAPQNQPAPVYNPPLPPRPAPTLSSPFSLPRNQPDFVPNSWSAPAWQPQPQQQQQQPSAGWGTRQDDPYAGLPAWPSVEPAQEQPYQPYQQYQPYQANSWRVVDGQHRRRSVRSRV